MSTRLFVGLQYSRQFLQREIDWFSSSAIFIDRVLIRSNIHGTGPRVGALGRLNLWRCFGLVGEAAGQVLITSARSFYGDNPIGIPTRIFAVNTEKVTAIDPACNLRFGVDVAFCLGSRMVIHGEVNYQLAYHFFGHQWVRYDDIARPGVSSQLSGFYSVDGWGFRLGTSF